MLTNLMDVNCTGISLFYSINNGGYCDGEHCSTRRIQLPV